MAKTVYSAHDIAKIPMPTGSELCSFCDEFDERGRSKRIIFENEQWVLVPTIGCFTPGYCLLLPRRHALSMAELGADNLQLASKLLTRLRNAVEERFGPSIMAEHGASVHTNGVACCEHAHMHLIPVGRTETVRFIYISRLGLPTRLSSMEDLGNLSGTPYIYLSSEEGEHLVWTDLSKATRQFARRAAAATLGKPSQYDWRAFPFENEMRKTRDVLRALNLG